MLEMAASGAKVLQLRSVEFARNHGVRLLVRSSFSDADGTWIREEDERMLEKAIISGVTHTVEEAIYRVEGAKASELFEALAAAGASVDTIIQTGPEIVFSAPFSDTEEVTRTLEGLGVQWSSREDLGKVSLVGAGMRTHPGIAGKTFSTLADIGVEPQIVNTSPIKIACFVARDDVERAVMALHDAFELDTEEAERAHD
jgi:aspartate kinase